MPTYIHRVLLKVQLLLIGVSLIVLSINGGTVSASDTGGYPWADASLLQSKTYDWGYALCQPAMQNAGTCDAHNIVRLGKTYHESDPWR